MCHCVTEINSLDNIAANIHYDLEFQKPSIQMRLNCSKCHGRCMSWFRIDQNICENLLYGLGLIKMSIKISIVVSNWSKCLKKTKKNNNIVVSNWSKYLCQSPLWSRIDKNIRENLRYCLGLLKISGTISVMVSDC